jgi:apolipoprotein N-acyltransferase
MNIAKTEYSQYQMKHVSNNRTPFYKYGIITVGILLFIFSNGRWIIPVAAWLSPIFLLHFTRSIKIRFSLPILFILMAISSAIMLYGIIPPDAGMLTIILTIYYAIIWFFPYIIDRLIRSQSSVFASTIIFPAAAVSAEFLNTIFFGSWASAAYTQYDSLVLMQLSSITGIWGITFLVMWLGSICSWALNQDYKWAVIRKGVVIYVSIFTIVMIFGGLRLGLFPPTDNTVKILSFTPTEAINSYASERNAAGYKSTVEMATEDRSTQSKILGDVHDQIFRLNNELITNNVALSIWPEGSIPVLEEDEVLFIAKGKEMADQNGIYLLMAYQKIPIKNPGIAAENKSVFINPNGGIEWEYLKAYPVPGSTDKPGDGRLPLTVTPFGRVSSAICYDMDFTQLIHQAGRMSIDLMVVPAWDWAAIDPLHTRMAIFRAIENGFSMVRQTGNGLSVAVDYQGRTHASMDQFTTDYHVLYADLPTRGTWTFYSFIGDLFAWICLVGLALGIGRKLVARN